MKGFGLRCNMKITFEGVELELGEGYRLLEPGDTLQPYDEWFDRHGRRWKSFGTDMFGERDIAKRSASNGGRPYRRKEERPKLPPKFGYRTIRAYLRG